MTSRRARLAVREISVKLCTMVKGVLYQPRGFASMVQCIMMHASGGEDNESKVNTVDGGRISVRWVGQVIAWCRALWPDAFRRGL